MYVPGDFVVVSYGLEDDLPSFGRISRIRVLPSCVPEFEVELFECLGFDEHFSAYACPLDPRSGRLSVVPVDSLYHHYPIHPFFSGSVILLRPKFSLVCPSLK